MNRINLLNSETSNKIAAGEVIERPFSVVKELVENSIDAGSTEISVEIEEGGLKNITITDNGQGIHPDDIEKAFLPHATSKIKEIEDIFNINTLGFRGEALASIAAVSKVNFRSRTAEFDFGRELTISGGSVESIKDTGCNIGSIINVKDLFYNVPARLKFMKSSPKESSSISDIISRLALSNNKIAFRLISNGKNTLQTYGTGNLKDTIRVIYGKSISENLIYFENHIDIATIYGYVGNAEISRGTRNHQSIFVNNRYIKSKLITAAVENALKSFLTINKFPFFVLFIDIYPELIDVNIHPTKAEVKFKDDREIFKLVFDGVHSGIRTSLKDKFDIPTGVDDFTISDNTDNSQYKQTLKEDMNLYNNNKMSQIENTFVDFPIDLTSIRSSAESNNNTFSNSNENRQLDFTRNIDNQMHFNHSNYVDSKASESQPQEENASIIPKFPPINYIGTFHNTYLLCEYGSELYIIDQHAAHERILFEKYREEISKRNVISQILLSPIILELSIEDYSIYNENIKVFDTIGFDIDTFGDNTIRIEEIPYVLGKLDSKVFFMQLLDCIKNMGSTSTLDIKYDNIARLACKAAIKANHKLNDDEVKALLAELRYTDNPFNCPHGRPTIIKMSLLELEKKFKRIQ